MRRTNIYLDDQQTDLLDRRAAEEGISRAELIRRLIDKGLHTAGDGTSAIHSAIDLSFGSMVEVEVPSRDSGAREDHLNRLWQFNA
ncbi:CopG family transcriptional regulator [Nesterenkonia muleiensis]|uniref:ribbon-helix-helix domain-containing protein n=1 Tax=Nesterenkonia muleiensis TaxID=2282648 RepID=UPI000E71C18A|nr:CopG family transcriptional regulator [Nesterenkonia muleiensis]